MFGASEEAAAVEDVAAGACCAGLGGAACANATAVPRLTVRASAAAGIQPGTDFKADPVLFNVVSFFWGMSLLVRFLYILPGTTRGRVLRAFNNTPII
jgi:hypothetical protein